MMSMYNTTQPRDDEKTWMLSIYFRKTRVTRLAARTGWQQRTRLLTCIFSMTVHLREEFLLKL